jgi:CO/xanthine dehydrogenase Mo-binding subunit
MPHGLRRFLAEQVFGMPQCHVRVVSGDVGESFSMRHGVYPELGLVLWGAKRLGRPVKWTAGRREGFLTDEHGRDNVSTSPAGRRSGCRRGQLMSVRLWPRFATGRAGPRSHIARSPLQYDVLEP